ncbi:hypothetical protein BJX70DRAFT_358523 [Aspergillus crustosus]
MSDNSLRRCQWLHDLWEAVVDPSLRQRLLNDNIVPLDFRAQHRISLVSHDISLDDTAATNLNHVPPILFYPRSPSVIQSHPIDLHGGYFRICAINPAPQHNLPRFLTGRRSVISRGISVASYIIDWAIHGFSRHLPPGALSLGRLCNLSAVR